MKAIRLLAVMAGLVAFLAGLRVFGRSYSSTRWPVTPGRITGSEIIAGEDEARHAAVDYEFILAGKVYRGRLTSREEPESLVALYPAGREIPVGFDPGDPSQSVLRPQLRWWSFLLAVAGAGLMVGGIVSTVKSRPALIALILTALIPGCRGGPPPEEAGAPPARDTGQTSVPEYYRFLAEPGVGIEIMDSIWARLPYDSIFLRREPCFGTCPMYEATLHRGGRASYTGTRFVERIGTYRGEVTLQDYGRLAYLLDRLEFMTLPDSFAAQYTDLPGATLAVGRRPEGGKVVHDYGYVGPVELWTMMEVFDGIVARIQWEKSAP